MNYQCKLYLRTIESMNYLLLNLIFFWEISSMLFSIQRFRPSPMSIIAWTFWFFSLESDFSRSTFWSLIFSSLMLSSATFALDFWLLNSSLSSSISCFWVCITSCSFFIISCFRGFFKLNICEHLRAFFTEEKCSQEIGKFVCGKPHLSQNATILRFSLKLIFHALPKDIYLLSTLVLVWYFHDLGIKYIWINKLIEHTSVNHHRLIFCQFFSSNDQSVWTPNLFSVLVANHTTLEHVTWSIYSSRGFTCFIVRLCLELFWYILQLIGYPLSSNFLTDLFSAVWLRNLKRFANCCLQSFRNFQSQITDATSWSWVVSFFWM